MTKPLLAGRYRIWHVAQRVLASRSGAGGGSEPGRVVTWRRSELPAGEMLERHDVEDAARAAEEARRVADAARRREADMAQHCRVSPSLRPRPRRTVWGCTDQVQPPFTVVECKLIVTRSDKQMKP